MSYWLLKQLHVSCVLLSGLGFLLRVWWMWRASPLLTTRLARTLPHGIDSTLLASALAMVILSGQYPFVLDWLTAKVLALVAYIVLGSMALKRGRTRRHRLVYALLAAACFFYIVSVALTKQATPWLN